MLGIKAPGDGIAPRWLEDEARSYSQAIHKQTLRARAPTQNQAGKDQDQKGQKTKGKGAGKNG